MQFAHTLHASPPRQIVPAPTSPPIVTVVVVVVFEWRREHVVSRAVIDGRDDLRPSRHYSLDPGNHPRRRSVLERVSHCVTLLRIRTAENHDSAPFFSVADLHCHFQDEHYPLAGVKNWGGPPLDIDVAMELARAFRTRKRTFNAF